MWSHSNNLRNPRIWNFIPSPSPATQIICYACSNIRDSTPLPTIIRVLTSSHYFFVLVSSDIFHGVTPFEETKNVAWLKSGPDLEYFERGRGRGGGGGTEHFVEAW